MRPLFPGIHFHWYNKEAVMVVYMIPRVSSSDGDTNKKQLGSIEALKQITGIQFKWIGTKTR